VGCLKNIVSLIVLILAIVGFYSVNGPDFVMNGMNGILNPTQQKTLEQAQKLANFSDISKNYKIKRAVDMLGVKAVLTEHAKTKQKMIVADTQNNVNITEADVKSNKIEQKIQQALDKFTFMSIKVGKFRVVGKSKMRVLGKTVPCVKIKANLIGLPYKEAEGVLGIVPQKNDNSLLFGSFNEEGKFNFKVAEAFFKELKPKTF
jgi:hypothetical protein